MPIGPKDPAELVVVTGDFALELNPGETITAIDSYVANTQRGQDSNPSAILYGAAVIIGSTIRQAITGGINGCAYSLKVTVDTNQGRTLVGSMYLPVGLE